MKILHQLGHNYKWALDSYFENKIGDGFIIGAYSIEKDKIGEKLSGYKPEDYLPVSLIDLQFYASKASSGDKLKTYDFHPINHAKSQATEVSTVEAALAGVRFQESLGLTKIIIPNIYISTDKEKQNTNLLKAINNKIKTHKKQKKNNSSYFLTIPISGSFIREDEEVERLLQKLTDMEIGFDGYYVACEPNLEARKKMSVDFKYYSNLHKIISTLKKQGFEIILGFANIDSLVFAALNNIDYVSVGTYENLRNFNIKRFTMESTGGKSDGWYYSEKIMNFISANRLEIFYDRDAIEIIRNENNIFSDVILRQGYPWNTHRPDVHKNYLLAISRQLKKISEGKNREERIAILESMIESARKNYKEIERKGIIVDDESSNYHLPLWLTILKTPSSSIVLK
ncbi:MAG: hypothetical protein HY505_00605 [Candidatus Yanofskybacteria bacterium]|nr:hypothetical protein [Candidatus Yanofskybacteria bacterium]